MRNKEDRSLFIKILRETPFISYAAQKSGVSRSTIYRWMKDKEGFKKETDQIQREGRDYLVDVAEMALVKKIKEGDMKAIIFFLSHNSKRYLPIRAANPVMTTELKQGQTCEICGQKKSNDYSRLSDEELKERIMDHVKQWGLIPPESKIRKEE